MAKKSVRIGFRKQVFGYEEYTIDTDNLEKPWEDMTEDERMEACFEEGELVEEYDNKSDRDYDGIIEEFNAE